MNLDEETLFIREMQEADREHLKKFFVLKNVTNQKRPTDNHPYLLAEFDVAYKLDSGYMKLGFDENDDSIIMCEMDVNFRTMIGLNRSPLELRILAENVLKQLKEDILELYHV